MNQKYSLIYILIFITIFCCSYGGVKAQNFSEDFTSPAAMVKSPANPSVDSWYFKESPVSAKVNDWAFSSGTAVISKSSNAPSGVTQSWLVTPAIDLLKAQNILSFREKQSKPAQNDGTKFAIKISTSSQSDLDGFATLVEYDETTLASSLTERLVDLSDFSGETVYLAFVKAVDGNGETWTIDDVIVTGSNVEEANEFTITSIEANQIDLEWQFNASNDSILLIYSESEIIDEPVEGKVDYLANDVLSNGAKVLYFGESVTTYSHTSLSEFKPYYYKIWSVNGEGEYSLSGIEVNGTTIGSTTIDYSDFEPDAVNNDGGLDGWVYNDDVIWPYDDWYHGSDQKYRGTYSAFVVTENNTTAGYFAGGYGSYNPPGYISLSKSIAITSGGATEYKSAELSFYWKASGEASKAYGQVYINDELVGDISEYCAQPYWSEQVIDIPQDIIGTTAVVEFRWYVKNSPATPYNPGFCVDDVLINGYTVEKPSNLAASASGVSNIVITWDENAASNNVLIAYSEDGSFGTPTKGVLYGSEDVLPGGGVVLYNGGDATDTHIDVPYNTIYYKAWSVGVGNVYSSAISTMASLPVALPFSDDFEGSSSSWTLGENAYNKFIIGKAQKKSGEKAAYVTTDNGISAGYSKLYVNGKDVELKLPINLRGFKSASVSYSWFIKGQKDNTYGQLYIDDQKLYADESENIHWYNQQMTEVIYQSTPYELLAVTDWQSEDIVIPSGNLGGISELKFKLVNPYGASGSTPGLCIDDVEVTGTIEDVADFTVVNSNTSDNTLSWERFVDSGDATNTLEDVIIVYSKGDDVIGAPVIGNIYSEGDILPDGGTVLYIGSDTEFSHTTLNLNTKYNYKIWHKSGYIYSDNAIERDATTPLNIGFFDDFEDDGSGYKATWNSDLVGDNNWKRGAPTDNGVTPFDGEEFLFVTADDGISAKFGKNGGNTTAVLATPIDLTGFNSATLSFYHRGAYFNATNYGKVVIDATPDISDEVLISYDAAVNDWTRVTVDLTPYVDKTITLKFSWKSNGNNPTSNNNSWCIDNVAVYGAFDNTSTLSIGDTSEPESIESISSDESSATQILDFKITDGGDGDNQPTDIHQVTIESAEANTITDLSDVLGGAYIIKDGETTGKIYANVYSSSLVFDQEDLISVADGDISTYNLFVWLKEEMDVDVDNETLALDLAVTNIVAFNGSGFDENDVTVVSSSADIDVVATELQFITQPSKYAEADVVMVQAPVVAATDVNGNIDENHNSQINITNNLSLPSSGSSLTSSQGKATFDALKFTANSDPATVFPVELDLTATDGTLSGSFSSVTVYEYCAPVATTNTKYITLVNLNTIDNYTGNDLLQVNYYLEQEAKISRTVEYELTVGTASSSGDYVGVWIDWNQDGDFVDTDEVVYVPTALTSDNQILQLSISVPETAILGGTRMRIMLSASSAMTSCALGGGAIGETEDYSIVVTNNQWIGSTPGWDVPSNWSTNTIPETSDNAHIAADFSGRYFPIISSDVTIGDLTIDAGAKITINEGVKFNAENVVNDGTIILKNRQDNLVSFIHNGTYTGAGEVHVFMYYPSNRYWYSGFPVTGFKSSVFNVKDNTNNVLLWNFSYARQNWDQILTDDFNFSNPTSAYSVAFKSATTIKLEGTLNSGDYTYDCTPGGYYSFGNPYPCFIDLDKYDNSSALSLPGNSVWTRTSINGVREWATYNFSLGTGALNGTSKVAPMQSFMVYASAGDEFAVKLPARDEGDGGVLKAASLAKKGTIRLKVANSTGFYDEAVVVLHSLGDEYLTDFDSKKIKTGSSKIPYIYSVKEGTPLSINVLPSDYQQLVVPFNISNGSNSTGQQRLTVEGLDCLDGNESAILVDSISKITTDLSETTSYEYTSGEVVDKARFSLVISKVSTTSQSSLDNDVIIWSSDHRANIHFVNNEESKYEVYIFTIDGVEIINDVISSSNVSYELPQNCSYIVKVVSSDSVLSKCIVVK